jgi:hypothetical protein
MKEVLLIKIETACIKKGKNKNYEQRNSANTSSIVSKVWAFCQTLRDDGVGYGDYFGFSQDYTTILAKANSIFKSTFG